MIRRRRLRWWWWPCAGGLILTVGAAVFSEFRTISYRERNNTGIGDYFFFSRSGITARFYLHKEGVILTGLDLFDDGWTMPPRYTANVMPRVWAPKARYDAWTGTPVSFWDIALPLWVPALVFALPTALGWRAARPKTPAQCPGCGYDRRGIPTAIPCPECGRAP